jgi:hypothetical protein
MLRTCYNLELEYNFELIRLSANGACAPGSGPCPAGEVPGPDGSAAVCKHQ